MLKSGSANQWLMYLRRPMKFDRSVAPAISPIAHPVLPEYSTVILDNGLELFVLHFPDSEILKIEVAFQAGRPEEKKRLAAYMTPRLMQEGAGEYSGAVIAEKFDFYGTSMSTWSWLDATGFILTGLSKYAGHTIPLFADVLLRPQFSPAELENLKQVYIGELKVELEKVEVISYRLLTEKLYGPEHPLGYNSTTTDYQQVSVEDLQTFYREQLNTRKSYILVTGNITQEVIDLLNVAFGKSDAGPNRLPRQLYLPNPVKLPGKLPKVMRITHPGALQTAVKMGRMLFNRFHPHYYEVQVLNTVLGGYFGSRLMTNIREDKGFTYNIYSGIDTYYDSGYMYIATEVNNDNVQSTVRAIRHEMKKLREQPVSDDELSMVKNYMTGALLNGFDGPLNLSGVLRAMIFEGLGKEGFEKQMSVLQNMTPARVHELAQMYLQPQDFLTVIVGP